MRKVAAPMIEMVRTKVNFRPTMSPIRPNTTAPNGRTANPVANVASVARKAVVGSPGG
jgi:hypothetical protein